MLDKSIISDELRSWLGKESVPNSVEVERGQVKLFAEAIGDTNPLYLDREFAGKSKYGAIIAPPTFLQDAALVNLVHKLVEIKSPLTRHLYGGVEMEFIKPMKVGDIITARSKLSELFEKEGKEGKLVFLVVDATYTNQHGEVVVKSRHTFIKR